MKMENERLCIEISEHGAEVTRIYDKKKETELLWEEILRIEKTFPDPFPRT